MAVLNTMYIPQNTLRMYLRTHYEYIYTSEHTRWLYLTQCIYLRTHYVCTSEHITYAPQNTLGKRSHDLGKKAKELSLSSLPPTTTITTFIPIATSPSRHPSGLPPPLLSTATLLLDCYWGILSKGPVLSVLAKPRSAGSPRYETTKSKENNIKKQQEKNNNN